MNAASVAVVTRNMQRAARNGMFRTSDRIDAAKCKGDAVALADARTSMCDYRLALAIAHDREADRNGFAISVDLFAPMLNPARPKPFTQSSALLGRQS